MIIRRHCCCVCFFQQFSPLFKCRWKFIKRSTNAWQTPINRQQRITDHNTQRSTYFNALALRNGPSNDNWNNMTTPLHNNNNMLIIQYGNPQHDITGQILCYSHGDRTSVTINLTQPRVLACHIQTAASLHQRVTNPTIAQYFPTFNQYYLPPTINGINKPTCLSPLNFQSVPQSQIKHLTSIPCPKIITTLAKRHFGQNKSTTATITQFDRGILIPSAAFKRIPDCMLSFFWLATQFVIVSPTKLNNMTQDSTGAVNNMLHVIAFVNGVWDIHTLSKLDKRLRYIYPCSQHKYTTTNN